MGSRSGWSLLASNTVVALIGAAAMLALVRAISTEPARIEHVDGRVAPPEIVVDRWAFAPPGTLSHLHSAPSLRPSFPGASEETASLEETPQATAEPGPDETAIWSTETRTSPTSRPAPHSTGFRFPWQRQTLPARPRHYTLKARLAELSPGAIGRLEKRFEAAKAPWPPAEIALIAIKDEKALELHAKPKSGPWTLVHRYRVLAASGKTGPKLVQGDKQVPEGLYRISLLNPNSAYHVSLRVNYPNAFDLKMAKKEGRKDLGGDIMIHGKDLSAGCLAVGDEAAEELFVLAARTGLAKVRLIIAPTDLRHKKLPEVTASQPVWLPGLYTEIAAAMTPFDAPQNIATSSTSSTPVNLTGIMSLFGQ